MKQYKFLLSILFVLLMLGVQAQDNAPYWSGAGNSNATTSSKLGTTNSTSLRLVTKNTERVRIDTLGRIGVGTTAPAALFDLRSTATGQLARFNGGSSQMYIGIYENSVQRGYIGSYAGNNEDVDVGTASSNTTGKVHLSIKAKPKLTVDTAGRVGIGTTTPLRPLDVINSTNRFTVRVINSFIGNISSIGISTTAISNPGYGDGIQAQGGYRGISAYGEGGSSSGAAYGVFAVSNSAFGSTEGTGSRYGVYGNAMGGVFNAAGYFEGAVWATSYNTLSDRKFKTSVAPLENSLVKLMKLTPATYRFKTSEYATMGLPEGEQLGLIADDVKSVFPSLVAQAVQPTRYNKDLTEVISPEVKYEGVNYLGLIPVLIASVQELKTENDKQQKYIDRQQQQIEDLKAMVYKLTNLQTPTTFSSTNALEQNTPNPVNGSTSIRYHITSAATWVRLILTNATGQTVKTVSLSNQGTGQINLNTQGPASGTYNYTLYVDGKPVDTKRIIIVK